MKKQLRCTDTHVVNQCRLLAKGFIGYGEKLFYFDPIINGTKFHVIVSPDGDVYIAKYRTLYEFARIEWRRVLRHGKNQTPEEFGKSVLMELSGWAQARKFDLFFDELYAIEKVLGIKLPLEEA